MRSLLRAAAICVPGCFAILLALVLCACTGTGPGPGTGDDPGENDDTHARVLQADDDYPDDTLESKNPAYVEYMVVNRAPGFDRGYMNGSDSVISLKIIEPEGGEETESANRLYRNFAEVYADTGVRRKVMPSIDLLDRYTKHTDDSAYGAIELACHDGDALYPGGRQGLLAAIVSGLLKEPSSPGRDLAAAFLGAALTLGGGAPDTAGSIAAKQQEIVSGFMEDAGLSKVLGFYAENETLKLVFRRDRLLQHSFGISLPSGIIGESKDTELEAMARIAAVLDDNPDLLEAYTGFQLMAERITNPASNLDLRDLLPFRELFDDMPALRQALLDSDAWQTKVLERNASDGTNAGVAVWPFSTSKETVLFRNVPAGADFMDFLVNAIRSGEVSLEPTELSGWYDFQTYALETFLLPEKGYEYQNLMMQGLYKKRLKSVFEAMLTQRRETHIKQLEIGVGPTSSPPPPPVPPLTVEPVPTHFLRTARGYSMLIRSLTGIMGDAAFAGIELADGSAMAADSLEQARALYYGLYLVSCCETGIAPALDSGELAGCTALMPAADYEEYLYTYPVALEPGISADAAARRVAACRLAREWLAGLSQMDGLLAQDSRVIVPVYYDRETYEWVCWAVIGVKVIKLEAAYARPPRVITYGYANEITPEQAREQLAASQNLASPAWESLERFLPVYEFAEVRLSDDPLTREEFRTVCDQCSTREEIIDALTGN